MQADPQSFDRIREGLARKYQNANMKPDRHASYLRLRALKHLWHVDDILLELKSLSPASVQASCTAFLTELRHIAGKNCMNALPFPTKWYVAILNLQPHPLTSVSNDVCLVRRNGEIHQVSQSLDDNFHHP